MWRDPSLRPAKGEEHTQFDEQMEAVADAKNQIAFDHIEWLCFW